MEAEQYIRALDTIGRLSEPAIRSAIRALALPAESRILDLPCGIGSHMCWFLDEYPRLSVAGADLAEEHIAFARERLQQSDKMGSCELVLADINKLEFESDSFDLVWCCDGLWPGPKDMACPAEEPYDILDGLVRITRPGGRVAIAFWSSHRLLPGFSDLETTLNATKTTMRVFHPSTRPELHVMRTPAWLRRAGLTDIEVKSFVADLCAPFDELKSEGLVTMFNLLWGQAEPEVSDSTWEQYSSLVNPESDSFILNDINYAGLLTYTMYVGTKTSG